MQRRAMLGAALRTLAELDAGAFAFVMATGIMSVAADLERLSVLSDALFALAGAGWAVLAAAVGRRMLRTLRPRPRPRPRLGSFAVAAATAVLGARFVLAGHASVALALWSLACVLWLGLLVRGPAVTEPTGSSLLVVVATESLAVLAAMLAPTTGRRLVAIGLGSWVGGLVLYAPVAGAAAAACLRGRRFRPDLWILMGALAIASLAASELLLAARAVSGYGSLGRWLPDADLATWALASALAVLLTAAEARVGRLRYEAARWSFVFPLGMYSVAGRTLAHAEGGLALVDDVARGAFVVALAAWTLVAAGLAGSTISRLRAG